MTAASHVIRDVIHAAVMQEPEAHCGSTPRDRKRRRELQRHRLPRQNDNHGSVRWHVVEEARHRVMLVRRGAGAFACRITNGCHLQQRARNGCSQPALGLDAELLLQGRWSPSVMQGRRHRFRLQCLPQHHTAITSKCL